jgi:STE24 endopeptidase
MASFYTSYKWVSLAMYNANVCWELYLTYRQWRCVKNATAVPAELRESISIEQFQKANAYSLDRMKVHVASTVFDCAMMNVMMGLDGFPALWYGSTFNGSFVEATVAHCLVFTAVSDVMDTILELPLKYYSIFKIEQKHGFNNQTPGLFLLDIAKGRLVNLVVSAPVYAGGLYILNRFGPKFPLYLAGFFTVTALGFSFIYPTLIQPLFNKFTTLQEGPLRDKIDALARQIKFPLTQVYVVDNSTRSNHSNAYFYGFFKNKRIVLYDTLLKQMESSDNALLAVLSHEFGHWKLGHNLRQLSLGILQMVGICYGASTIVYNEACYRSFGFHTSPRIVGLMLFVMVVMTPVDALLSCAVTAFIRRMEFEADRFACDMGYGDDLQKALLLMRESNSMSVVFDKLYAACKYTHPPLLQRLKAIQDYTKSAKKLA